jgi:hypothetical protein
MTFYIRDALIGAGATLGAGLLVLGATQISGCGANGFDIPYNKRLQVTSVAPYPMHDASTRNYVHSDSFIEVAAQEINTGDDNPETFYFLVKVHEDDEPTLKRTAGVYDGKFVALPNQPQMRPWGPLVYPVRVEEINGTEYIWVDENGLRVYDSRDQDFPKDVPLHGTSYTGVAGEPSQPSTLRRRANQAIDSLEQDTQQSEATFLGNMQEALRETVREAEDAAATQVETMAEQASQSLGRSLEEGYSAFRSQVEAGKQPSSAPSEDSD